MGEILLPQELNQPIGGPASIIIFDKKKTDQKKLLDYWLKYYETESCGACSACREGTYRLRELSLESKFDKGLFNDLIHNLEESTLCALGASLAITVKSFNENIKLN